MLVRELALVAAGVLAVVQPPQFSNAVRTFITLDAAVIALTNARVIDGTGAPARQKQTLVIRGGDIAEVGDTGRVVVPEGATTIDRCS